MVKVMDMVMATVMVKNNRLIKREKMSEYSKGQAEGLQRNLDLIRKYGTDKDKDCLRGSGMAGNKPLSKTFYRRLYKATGLKHLP